MQPLTHHPILDVAVGCEYTIALDHEHNLWSWGTNTDGQLGVGNINPQYIPCHVSSVVDKELTRVSAGKLL